ncbi:hypothetical protein [uncultured Akkermansia sp.]|uniref:hypothetical protein n=1 Tax=uncultured Akkermansia sp. TaxID=512294 RepID=UPI0025DA6ADB|nr:hypothetical protein [uncultured Akkermansia sp.]
MNMPNSLPVSGSPAVSADSSAGALRCVFLLTSGEALVAERELECQGYAVEGYPCTQDVSTLRDCVPVKELDFFMPRWRDLNTPYVRSLRCSYARMLMDPRWEGDDFIIFGESDAAAVTEAAVLRKALEREMEEHPETDVFRLHHHVTLAAGEKPGRPEQFLFSPYQTASRTKASLYVWGMHALVIPAASRAKVAKVFLDNMLPIDNALEMASSRGELNVRVADHNHFYQQHRLYPDDRTVSCAWRKERPETAPVAPGAPQKAAEAAEAAVTEECGGGKCEKALPPLPVLSGVRRGVCTLARQGDSPEGLRVWITNQLKAGASVVAVFVPEGGTPGGTEAGSEQTEGEMRVYLDDVAQKYGRERVWVRLWRPLSLRGRDLAAMLEDRMKREDEGLEECVFLERG